MNHPRTLLIVTALFMALITGINFVGAPNSEFTGLAAAASMSGGSSGASNSGGGGW